MTMNPMNPGEGSGNGFEAPGTGGQPGERAPGAEEAGVSGFAVPSHAEGVETAAVEARAEAAIDARLLDARDAVVAAMQRALVETAAAGMATAQQIEGIANIQGVGISFVGDGAAALPGEPALTIYVAEPTDLDAVRSVLVDQMGVHAAATEDVPVQVVVTGVIDAFAHRMRLRPAPGGISIGHCQVTAGTLGCLARGRQGTARHNRLMLLSNNHVIANSNSAAFGDWIIQPGRYDGGTCTPNDRIAILERFVPINFSGGTNYVDCATGWCWPNLVRHELMYLSGGAVRYFRIGSTPVNPARGMWVGKSGRTTQLTRGYVTDVNATIRVNYGSGRVALFSDQMAIRAASGDFSAGGDSGSAVWSWDARRAPVGLLFAGGGGVTFANKMTRVLAALDIQLYT